MAKKIEKQFKVLAPGGQATPAPPLGPALGANGVNPGQFIQMFNDRTRELNGKVVGCKKEFFFTDREQNIEIDDEFDFWLAEQVLLKRQNENR